MYCKPTDYKLMAANGKVRKMDRIKLLVDIMPFVEAVDIELSADEDQRNKVIAAAKSQQE